MTYFKRPLTAIGGLGDIDAVPGFTGDLQVKEYPGGRWASYQSPSSDRMLRALQGELVRAGWVAIPKDGVITAAAKAAAAAVGIMYRSNTTPIFGGRIDTAARALESLAVSPERLATRGAVAYGYLKAINDGLGKPAVAFPALRSAPPVAAAPSDGSPPPAPTPIPDESPFAVLKSPLGLAAIGVGALLLYQATRGGRRRRR